jgi:hypothetical protein
MATPIATIVEDTIAIDHDKLAEHLAKEKAKLMKEKLEIERKELVRLTDARIQFEKFESEERKKREKLYQAQLDAEWALNNPAAADERVRQRHQLARDEQEKKDRELVRQIKEKDAAAERELLLYDVRQQNKKNNIKLVGVCFGGVTIGLFFYASFL